MAVHPASNRETRAIWLSLFLIASTARVAGSEELVRRVPFQPPAFEDMAVPDEFVVAFKLSVAHRLEVRPDPAGRPRANLAAVQRAIDRGGLIGLERQFRTARAQAAGSRFPDLTGYYLARVPAGADLATAMATIAAEPDVDHVEPIGLHPVDATPGDPYYAFGTSTFAYDQWHYWDLNGIDADQAWDLEAGDGSVVVGILDSGVKYRHSDLGGPNPPGPGDNDTQGNIWVNPFEIPGNGIDDEGNGFVDDVIGWDFVSTAGGGGVSCLDNDCGQADHDPNDGDGHGTHVAGTVAAITHNARAVAGVAGGFSDGTTAGAGNGVKVMCLRMGYHARYQGQVTGIVNMAWAAQAMNYVADMKDRGVNIAAINCSWGNSDTGGLGAAVDNLLAHDVMIMNSSGNSNSSVVTFLGGKAGVMAVGATDSTGVGASFSNFGSWVEIGAPGVTVLSTYHDPTDPDTTHMYVGLLDGTSMASPHAVGVAALLESYNPALTAAQKSDLMINNTSPFAPANTKVMGSGILNARLALDAAPSPVSVGDPGNRGRSALALRLWPNPVRAATEFVVAAAPGERVRITVLDAAGRKVREIEAVTGVGAARARWDGRDASGGRVAAGLYFAQAHAGARSATLRFVVLD